jgi:hypothetical protein
MVRRCRAVEPGFFSGDVSRPLPGLNFGQICLRFTRQQLALILALQIRPLPAPVADLLLDRLGNGHALYRVEVLADLVFSVLGLCTHRTRGGGESSHRDGLSGAEIASKLTQSVARLKQVACLIGRANRTGRVALMRWGVLNLQDIPSGCHDRS